MNKSIILGRLTKDPEVRYTQSGKAVASFTLAVNRRMETEADFIPVKAWEKRAEFAEKYLHKGTKVLVTGHIQTGSYDRDGRKIYTTDVIAEDIEFAESKGAKTEEKEGFISLDKIEEDMPFK